MNKHPEMKIINNVKVANKDFINQQIEVLENLNMPKNRQYWHFNKDVISALKNKMSKMTETEIIISLRPVKLGLKSVNKWILEKRVSFKERDDEYAEVLAKRIQ